MACQTWNRQENSNDPQWRVGHAKAAIVAIESLKPLTDDEIGIFARVWSFDAAACVEKERKLHLAVAELARLRARACRVVPASEPFRDLTPARWIPPMLAWTVSHLMRGAVLEARHVAEAVGCEVGLVRRLIAGEPTSPHLLIAVLQAIHGASPIAVDDLLNICRMLSIDDTLPLVFTGQSHELAGEILRRMRSDVLAPSGAPAGATAVDATGQARARVTPNYDGRGREVPLESPYALSPKGVVA